MSENGASQVGGTEKGQTVIVVQGQSSALGICSIICSVISIFFIALLFAPLGILLGIIAVAKKQTALGVISIIIAVVFIVANAFEIYSGNLPPLPAPGNLRATPSLLHLR